MSILGFKKITVLPYLLDIDDLVVWSNITGINGFNWLQMALSPIPSERHSRRRWPVINIISSESAVPGTKVFVDTSCIRF